MDALESEFLKMESLDKLEALLELSSEYYNLHVYECCPPSTIKSQL